MGEPPDYLALHPHLRAASLEVGRHIADLQGTLAELEEAGARLELEGRLGRLVEGRFDANVGSDAFCAVLSMLESFPRWSRTTGWEETQDVFYAAPLPGPEGPREQEVRTSVRAARGRLEVEHLQKQKLRRVDLALQRVDDGCAPGGACAALPLDARITLAAERPLRAEVLPLAVSPRYVRIKQRKRFFLPSVGVPRDCFSFDLSIVYAGGTKSEAERRQRAGEEASFEVECECLAPREYLRTTRDPVCLALSVLVKLHDFAAALNPGAATTFVPTA